MLVGVYNFEVPPLGTRSAPQSQKGAAMAEHRPRDPARLSALSQADLDRFRTFVRSSRWTTAKVDGQFAHQYTIRTQVDEREFVWVADLIARVGYGESFFEPSYMGRPQTWRYLRTGGWRFWISRNGRDYPFMVNRACDSRPDNSTPSSTT